MKTAIVLAILLVLSGVMAIVVSGSKKIEAERVACEKAGGVQVKQYDGFACIAAQRVKP